MPRNFLGVSIFSSHSMILSEHPGLQGNRDKKRELEKGGKNSREEANRHLGKSVKAYFIHAGKGQKGKGKGDHKTLNQYKITSQHSKQR